MRYLWTTARRWWARARSTPRARDVTDAVSVGAVGLLALGIGLVDVWAVGGGTVADPWEHVVTLTLGCLLMLGKRHAPGTVVVAGGVVFGVDVWLGGSLGPLLVLFDLVYSAALHGSPAVATRLRAGSGLAVAAGVVAGFWLERDVRVALFLGLQVFAIVVAPLWWGLSVRRQADLARLAEERAEDLRRIARLREQEVRGDERTRMARDLHDAIAGNLSAIALHAEGALLRPADDDGAPARDRAALVAVRAAAVTSLAEMRSMILLLRGDDDAAVAPPRLAELPALVEATRAAGHEVELAGDALTGPARPLPAAADQAAYRIAQEALTNAVKHAPGGRSTVRAGADDGELRLEVVTVPADRPPVPRAAPGAGLGLLTMRERAESLGGTFDAGPADDGSWTVRATLPLTPVEVP